MQNKVPVYTKLIVKRIHSLDESQILEQNNS